MIIFSFGVPRCGGTVLKSDCSRCSTFKFRKDLAVIFRLAAIIEWGLTPHSFHVRAATSVAASGIPEDTIQRMSQWCTCTKLPNQSLLAPCDANSSVFLPSSFVTCSYVNSLPYVALDVVICAQVLVLVMPPKRIHIMNIMLPICVYLVGHLLFTTKINILHWHIVNVITRELNLIA